MSNKSVLLNKTLTGVFFAAMIWSANLLAACTPERSAQINLATATGLKLTDTLYVAKTSTPLALHTFAPTPIPPTATFTQESTLTATPTATISGLEVRTTSTLSPTTFTSFINWDEAKQYVGEEVTVCGPVMGSHYAQSSNGQPTFLNLGADYPDPNRFVVLIWGQHRMKFPTNPEIYFKDQTICVTGKVTIYDGLAEIMVDDPVMISIQ